MSWMEFVSRKQLAGWLLWSDQGQRFLSWLLRKHWKQILSTEAGFAASEWIRKKIIEEEQQSVAGRRIVIERFPDGFLKVYAEKGDVVFIHRLAVSGDQAEVLEEQLASLNCPRRAREVYNGRVLATDFYQGRTVDQEVKRQSRIAISEAIGRPDPKKNRIDRKPGASDNVVGVDRALGQAGVV